MKIGNLYTSKQIGSQCGLVITAILENDVVRFRGVGKNMGIATLVSIGCSSRIASTFDLASELPTWMPALPPDIFVGCVHEDVHPPVANSFDADTVDEPTFGATEVVQKPIDSLSLDDL